MKRLNALVLALLLLSPAVQAEEQLIQVPGEGWAVRLNAPRLDSSTGPGRGVFFGKADRLQVSIFVDAPRCQGSNSDEKMYECFAASLKKNPVVKWESERANTRPNGGVLVMYMTHAEVNGTTGNAFNINVLLAKNGKWVDMHASIASPTREDIASLLTVAASMTIVGSMQENESAISK